MPNTCLESEELKTALHLLNVRGRKVAFSSKTDSGFFMCVPATLHACVSLLLSLQPHYPAFIELSVSIKLAHFVSEGQFEAAQQLTESALSTREAIFRC